VLIPDAYSDEWQHFCDELTDLVDERGCRGRPYCATLLLEQRGYHVEATLALFRQRGGYCDCEVLFNVDPPTLEDELDEIREAER
jgi:Protein of unknown function (DUF2695)